MRIGPTSYAFEDPVPEEWYPPALTRMSVPCPYHAADPDSARAAEAELRRELDRTHELHGVRLETYLRCGPQDDVLFRVVDATDEFVVVHLTFSGRLEGIRGFPSVTFRGPWRAFRAFCERHYD